MRDVVIVGAGMAGLSCATRLTRAGASVSLLESTDRVGGRVRTDVVDGYQLDHGFQTLSCAAEGCRELLDYESLRLRYFDPGALVFRAEELRYVADPWGTAIGDSQAESISPLSCFHRSGPVAIPADGMAAIPRQLAERLPRGTLQLQRTVESLTANGVRTSDGETMEARVVVLATESSAAGQLASSRRRPSEAQAAQAGALDCSWRRAATVYFAAPAPPHSRPLVMIAGDAQSPLAEHLVDHLVVLTNVAGEYGPAGRALIAVGLSEAAPSLADSHRDVVGAIRREAGKWFGSAVDSWRLLRSYDIPYAYPHRAGDPHDPVLTAEPWGGTGPVVCGDHRTITSVAGASMAGAIDSGLRAADVALRRLGHRYLER